MPKSSIMRHAAQFKTISEDLRQLAPDNNLAQMLEVDLQRDPETVGTTRGLYLAVRAQDGLSWSTQDEISYLLCPMQCV